MATIDIRNEVDDKVTVIVFADGEGADGITQAKAIALYDYNGVPYVSIEDMDGDVVIINSKEHAQNLIKALNKAIELGWLK